VSGVIVVLSGGGGRALAHLGVLEVLEDAGVPIDRIVGVSGGAVTGALFGCLPNARAAQQFLAERLAGDSTMPVRRRARQLSNLSNGMSGAILRLMGAWRLVRRAGMVRCQHLLDAMESLFGEQGFDDLRVPLSVVTTDLVVGRQAILGSGRLQPTLAATCALPGIFEPVSVGDRLCVDSGDVNPLPVHVAKRYRPAFTIAVDVSRGRLPPMRALSGVDAVARSRDAGALIFRETERQLADLIIQPRVLRRDWTDYSDPEQAYQAGRAAAHRKLRRLCAGLAWKEIAQCETD